MTRTRLIALFAAIAGAGCPGPAPVDEVPPLRKETRPADAPGESSAFEAPESGLPPAPSADVTPGDVPLVEAPQIDEPSAVSPPQAARPAEPPIPDEATLSAAGIRRLDFERLTLLTDLDASQTRHLEAFCPHLWSGLRAAFGPITDLDPETRLVGHVMQAPRRFADAGLLPADLGTSFHGRVRGWRLWMRAGNSARYREHLLAHEATHCYTLAVGLAGRPVEELEGIAEWFATHEAGPDGSVRFGAVPSSADAERGVGRVATLRRMAATDAWPTLQEVSSLGTADFERTQEAYAAVWAKELLRVRTKAGAGGSSPELWSWYRDAVDYAVDPARSAPRLEDPPRQLIAADRGWQPTDVIARAGDVVSVEASGGAEVNVAGQTLKSTPAGVRYDYVGGLPIGALLATILVDEEARTSPLDCWSAPAVCVPTFTAERPGRVFLRVNDDWAGLGQNRGGFDVRLRRVP